MLETTTELARQKFPEVYRRLSEDDAKLLDKEGFLDMYYGGLKGRERIGSAILATGSLAHIADNLEHGVGNRRAFLKAVVATTAGFLAITARFQSAEAALFIPVGPPPRPNANTNQWAPTGSINGFRRMTEVLAKVSAIDGSGVDQECEQIVIPRINNRGNDGSNGWCHATANVMSLDIPIGNYAYYGGQYFDSTDLKLMEAARYGHDIMMLMPENTPRDVVNINNVLQFAIDNGWSPVGDIPAGQTGHWWYKIWMVRSDLGEVVAGNFGGNRTFATSEIIWNYYPWHYDPNNPPSSVHSEIHPDFANLNPWQFFVAQYSLKKLNWGTLDAIRAAAVYPQ